VLDLRVEADRLERRFAVKPLSDDLNREALGRIDKIERSVKTFVTLAALVEGGCLVGFLLLMDYHDRTHQLLLLSVFWIYGTLAFGLMSLGAYVRTLSLKLFQAIDLQGGKDPRP
jgi:hypothetical protein